MRSRCGPVAGTGTTPVLSEKGSEHLDRTRAIPIIDPASDGGLRVAAGCVVLKNLPPLFRKADEEG
jgi:hypothetical protein